MHENDFFYDDSEEEDEESLEEYSKLIMIDMGSYMKRTKI